MNEGKLKIAKCELQQGSDSLSALRRVLNKELPDKLHHARG
jgi:hypothetical protein